MQRTSPPALESQASRGLAGQLLASLVLALAVLAAVVAVSYPLAAAVVGTAGVGALLAYGVRSAVARRRGDRERGVRVPRTDVTLRL